MIYSNIPSSIRDFSDPTLNSICRSSDTSITHFRFVLSSGRPTFVFYASDCTNNSNTYGISAVPIGNSLEYISYSSVNTSQFRSGFYNIRPISEFDYSYLSFNPEMEVYFGLFAITSVILIFCMAFRCILYPFWRRIR